MTQNYLENTICNLTPLFKIDYRKKQNLISCSLFKISEKHNSKYFDYIEGIQKLSYYASKNIKDFRIRLFIDRNIYENENIMKLLNDLDIDLVLFDCPNFKNKKTYHIGFFGTLVRFFPLFDFPNNDSKFVIIADTNWSVRFQYNFFHNIYLYNKIKNMKEFSSVNFFTKGILHEPQRISGYNIYIDNFFYPYSLATALMGLKKLDNVVLINFLKNVEKSNKDLTFYHNEKNYIENPKEKISHLNFIYGVDEYFISDTLREYVIKNKREYFQNIRYIISDSLYYSIKENPEFKKENPEFKKLFNYVFKNLKNYKFTNTLNEFKKLDKILYNKDIVHSYGKKITLNKFQKDIFFRLYQYYISIYNTDKVKIYDKKFLTIILNDIFLGYPVLNCGIRRTFKINKLYIFKMGKLSDSQIIFLKNMKKEYGVKDVDFKISNKYSYL